MSDHAFHIFICFSSKDEAVARDVLQFLEAEGLTCWISSRDIPPGQNYQESIVHALETAGCVVFLFSEFSRQSAEIRKELSIAGSLNVPVFPLRLSPITPRGALRYELATRQWIDIFPDREYAFHRLVEALRMIECPGNGRGRWAQYEVGRCDHRRHGGSRSRFCGAVVGKRARPDRCTGERGV